MDDYIKRSDAIEALHKAHSPYPRRRFISVDAIKNVPPADVRPVARGEWREYNYPGEEHVYCSECKEKYYVDDLLMGRNDYPKFCPNCGADMRGDT